MQQSQILQLINTSWGQERIASSTIALSKYNQQPDLIEIVFNDEFNPLSQIGSFTDGLENLIIADGYGDLTEISIHATSFHHLGEDLVWKLTFTPNIDS